MGTLIALAIGGGLVALGWSYWRKKSRVGSKNPQGEKRRPSAVALLPEFTERTLDQLQRGDVVMAEGEDYIVRGVASFRDDGKVWLECALDLDGETPWLYLPGHERDRPRLGRAVPGLVAAGHPSEAIDFEGQIFRLTCRGQARCETTDKLEPYSADVIEYWEYVRPDGRCLWIRRVGQTLHGYAGQQLDRHMIDMLPGS
jgi:hypothetical protein